MLISPIGYRYQPYRKNTAVSSPAFRAAFPTKEKLFNDIKDNGYTFYKEVDVINPNNEKDKALAFLKKKNASSGGYSVYVLLANRYGYALGELIGSTSTEPGIMDCTIKNYTRPIVGGYSPLEWMDKGVNKCEDGYYRKVGTRCYELLEEYVKNNDKSISRFHINATNGGSWEFHCKIFGHPEWIDDYDTYAFRNEMYKPIK